MVWSHYDDRILQRWLREFETNLECLLGITMTALFTELITGKNVQGLFELTLEYLHDDTNIVSDLFPIDK